MATIKRTFLILSPVLVLFFIGLSNVQASPAELVFADSLEKTTSSTQYDLNLPLVFGNSLTPIPPPANPSKVLVCSAVSSTIQDNNPAGVTNLIGINDPRYIYDLEIRLDVSHSSIGDLVASLTHLDYGNAITLIERPGPKGQEGGCTEDNIAAILDDDVSLNAKRECAASPAAISGIYLPDQPLGTFATEPIAGNWVLSITDLAPGQSGTLNNWCIVATLTDTPTLPEPPIPPPSVPENATISGVTGQGQALPLDCESRSAIDWANYYGKYINELNFFNNLPVSDNPDAGFVGNVYGQWGQIPPAAYGVHAEPIAKLLRDYGLPAQAQKNLRWDDLKAEIASGEPVIVWIIGTYNASMLANAIPEYYLPTDGLLSIVARYEHTVIVTGYSASTVTFLNGAYYYTISLNQFLESWSALGNMAVTYQP